MIHFEIIISSYYIIFMAEEAKVTQKGRIVCLLNTYRPPTGKKH